jgi:MFS family permease
MDDVNEKTGLISSKTRQHQLSDPSVDLENETGVPDGSSLDHASTAAEKQQNTTRKITADDVLNFVGFGPFQVIAVFLAGFTYFAYGVDASIFIYIGDNVRAHWNLTGTEYAAMPASTCLPNVVGAFLFSYLTDRFGRVWPYAICMIWIGVFSIVSAFANSFPLLIVLRCGASLAIGAVAGLTFPTLIEFLPVQNRGKASILNGVIGISGLCVSCGLAWWLLPTYPNLGWRYYIMASGVPSIIVGICRLILYVESPRYLMARDRKNEAWNVFKIMARFNRKDINSFSSKENFCRNFSLNESHCEHTKRVRNRFIILQLLEIFRKRYLRRTIPLSIIIMTQSIGYYTSQLFLIDFLKRIGADPYFTILSLTLAQIPGFLLMSIIVEWPRVGRLNTFRFFSILSMIFFFLLAFIQNTVSIPVFLILIYFSAAPNLGLLYTYVSEAYPTTIRAISTSYFYIIQALSYMCGAFVSGYVEDLPQTWLYPVVYACVFFIQLLAGLVLNHETYGRRLQDTLD